MAKKKKSAFSGKISKSVAANKAKGNSYGYLMLPSGVNMWSPTPGSKGVKIDILPYIISDKNHPDKIEDSSIAMKGDEWYRRPFSIHRNIGANNDAVVCLKSFGKKCPLCEERDRLFKNDASKAETDVLKASKRNLYVVVPLNSDKHDKVPHLFDMSDYLFQQKLNDEMDEDPDNEAFPDLEDGLTLNIRFSSETIGSGKPFAEVSRIDFEKRKEQYKAKEISKKIPDLDSILKELSYSKLEAMFQEEDEVKEEVDETPKKKKEKKSKKKKAEVIECPQGWEFGKDFMKKKKVCKKCKFKIDCENEDLPF